MYVSVDNATTNNYYFLDARGNNGVTNVFAVKIEDDEFWYYNGSWHSLGLTAVDNKWYHVRVDFERTTGGYMGLSQNNWDLYIDNVLRKDNAVFNNNIDIDGLAITPGTNGAILNVDAVGYSWDPNYEIGDNMNEGLLLSYENITALDWAGYSLDGAANVTIQGNTTIPMPTGNGLHSIQMFANTSTGTTYQSDVRYFTLDWEYASLRPITNYLDMIDELDLHIEISMKSIGFLKIDRTSSGYPTFPYLDNNQTHISFYNLKIFNANFDEDEFIMTDITLRFYYNPAEVNNLEDLRVYHYISSQGMWISEAVTLNQADHYVEITITELSWFGFAEFLFPSPPVDFLLLLPILIIALSVIGISIPSSYVVISKKKKKKKGVIQGKKKQTLLKKKLTPHKSKRIIHREKVSEIRREQLSPIPPVESKVIRRTEPHKKLRKKKIEAEKTPIQVESEEVEKKREIEKTEIEMDIAEDIDKCIVHKGQIRGVTYICPKCNAKYCFNCAQALVSAEEPCWVCEKPIKLGVRSIDTENSEPVKLSSKKSKKTNAQDDFDNTKVLNIFKQSNLEENINLGGNLTTISNKFWESIDKFEWEENEKKQFIKEMLSLSPDDRQNVIESMLKDRNEGK